MGTQREGGRGEGKGMRRGEGEVRVRGEGGRHKVREIRERR